MTEVHRYKAVQLISMGGAHIGYDPHGPDVVMAFAYDEQHAQLGDQDALLREVLELIDDGVGRSEAEWQLIRKLRAALHASAEPSAPVAPYPNRLCHIDYTAHPYQCGCLRGDEESQRIYDEHCGASSAEPNAQRITKPNADCAICRDLGDECMTCEEQRNSSSPVERDERAAFEAQISYPPLRQRTKNGNYSYKSVESEWKGWQARATLDQSGAQS